SRKRNSGGFEIVVGEDAPLPGREVLVYQVHRDADFRQRLLYILSNSQEIVAVWLHVVRKPKPHSISSPGQTGLVQQPLGFSLVVSVPLQRAVVEFRELR